MSPTPRARLSAARKSRGGRAPSPNGSMPRAGAASGIRAATISTPASRRCARRPRHERTRHSRARRLSGTCPRRCRPATDCWRGCMPIGTIALDAFAALCDAARTLRQRHHRSHLARQHSGARPDAQTSAPRIRRRDRRARYCGGGRRSGRDQCAGRTRCRRRSSMLRRSLRRLRAAHRATRVRGAGSRPKSPSSSTAAVRSVSMRLRPTCGCARKAHGGDPCFTSASAATAHAPPIGVDRAGDGVEAAIRLLDVIARARPRRARPRYACSRGSRAYSAMQWPSLLDWRPTCARVRRRRRSVHIRLRDGTLAVGIGLAFGHADAKALERLFEAAQSCRRERPAHRARARALGGRLAPEQRTPFAARRRTASASSSRADDPRRNVIACAGAPICASAHIAVARPRAGDCARPQRRSRRFDLHISGCAKGCAHAGGSALTIVGTAEGCGLVVNGSARDAPFAVLSASDASRRDCGRDVRKRQPGRAAQMSEPCLSDRPQWLTAYLRDGTAIYERSFAIIRAEADLSRFSAEEADVAVRMIHACGQVDVAQHIVFGGRPRRRRARRARGRRADPLRFRDGGAWRHAGAAAGAATK